MKSKKEIGGYFELELQKKVLYHKNAILLNSGRSCLEYILMTKKFRKIYLPHYICDSILEPIKKTDLIYSFYSIDEKFYPQRTFNLKKNEAFLYVNYFGLCDKNVNKLRAIYKNLIVDNTQAFFSKPKKDVDTFYSARKFLGVPDGGILYTNKKNEEEYEVDESYKRGIYLLKRIDVDASSGLKLFEENEISLSNTDIKRMSKLTKSLLESIDYKEVIEKRNFNFNYLHTKLAEINELKLNWKKVNAPFAYPLLINKSGVRDKLIENKIYVPMLWKNVFKWTDADSWERVLTKYLLPIPIDQRYNIKDMNRIITTLKSIL